MGNQGLPAHTGKPVQNENAGERKEDEEKKGAGQREND